MSAGILAIVVMAVVVAAVVAAVLMVWPMLRRRRLRDAFGPEYNRAVEAADGRLTAERELLGRERRHAEFDLRELSTEQKKHYSIEWAGVQQQFVDNPSDAMTSADRLVTTIMAERGYPIDSYDQRLADLSVEHTAPLGHYRAAHDIATRPIGLEVSTEDMRTAIVHYRELFQDLLNGGTPNRNKKDAML